MARVQGLSSDEGRLLRILGGIYRVCRSDWG
jgi:hypothetical protein